MAGVSRMKITHQEWVAQWNPLPQRFDLNVWNFQVQVGREGVSIFKKSFDLKRFNSKGSTVWRHRPKRNQGGYTVGGLVESGSLKNSIRYKTTGGFTATQKETKIYTDPTAFSGTFSHRGFCFADVHNSSDTSVRTGRVARMPQRQFMPTDKKDSTVMRDKLRELGKSMIFKAFPGSIRR